MLNRLIARFSTPVGASKESEILRASKIVLIGIAYAK
jgi:hypothetical protein